MGAAKVALVGVALATLASRAHAEECTGISSRLNQRFATCFDLGNRLSVTAGSEGFGLAIGLRHEITFEDDPDLEWKMEHRLVEGGYSLLDDRFTGTFYRGRYLRHSRDGHIVIPIGVPKKVFLPFDIGALFEVGKLDFQRMQPSFQVGVVRVAPVIDFARALNYRRVFAIGPSMHWDMDVDRSFKAVTEQTVAPFTEGLVTMRLESSDGLYSMEARAEAGTAWHSDRGWHPEARAEATLERIVIAIRDKPVAITAGVQYDSARAETLARIGARFVVFDRTDPRVSLHPPRVAPPPPPPVVMPPVPAPLPPPEVPTDVHTPEPDPTPDAAGNMIDGEHALAFVLAV